MTVEAVDLAGNMNQSEDLLITIDTLRADHLSAYGYYRPTSPVIDQLAAEGVRFDRPAVQWPKTGPSFASMFTSTYPKDNGIVRRDADHVVISVETTDPDVGGDDTINGGGGDDGPATCSSDSDCEAAGGERLRGGDGDHPGQDRPGARNAAAACDRGASSRSPSICRIASPVSASSTSTTTRPLSVTTRGAYESN